MMTHCQEKQIIGSQFARIVVQAFFQGDTSPLVLAGAIVDGAKRIEVTPSIRCHGNRHLSGIDCFESFLRIAFAYPLPSPVVEFQSRRAREQTPSVRWRERKGEAKIIQRSSLVAESAVS